MRTFLGLIVSLWLNIKGGIRRQTFPPNFLSLLLLLTSAAVLFGGGCLRKSQVLCTIPDVAMLDKNGHLYGYHACIGQKAGVCAYSIKYSTGPYKGMVFRLHYDNEETQDGVHIRVKGEKFYFHRE